MADYRTVQTQTGHTRRQAHQDKPKSAHNTARAVERENTASARMHTRARVCAHATEEKERKPTQACTRNIVLRH